jgi:hypothetical protein
MNQCYICLEESNYENFIHPCKCRGSIGCVHEDCLKRWLIDSGRTDCPQCNYVYRVQMVYDESKHYILGKVILQALGEILVVIGLAILYTYYSSDTSDDILMNIVSAFIVLSIIILIFVSLYDVFMKPRRNAIFYINPISMFMDGLMFVLNIKQNHIKLTKTLKENTSWIVILVVMFCAVYIFYRYYIRYKRQYRAINMGRYIILNYQDT